MYDKLSNEETSLYITNAYIKCWALQNLFPCQLRHNLWIQDNEVVASERRNKYNRPFSWQTFLCTKSFLWEPTCEILVLSKFNNLSLPLQDHLTICEHYGHKCLWSPKRNSRTAYVHVPTEAHCHNTLQLSNCRKAVFLRNKLRSTICTFLPVCFDWMATSMVCGKCILNEKVFQVEIFDSMNVGVKFICHLFLF